MKRHGSDAWSADGGIRMYIDNGQRYFSCDRGGDSDLVAEWTEPKTKGCAAAEVDNLRDEYGPVSVAPATPEPKFKVGDRVRALVDAPKGHVGIIHTFEPYNFRQKCLVSFEVWRKGHSAIGTLSDNSGWWMAEDEMERLAEDPTIRPGQFVTLQGYVRSINGKMAHVDIIGPDVPYNRSYPLSALRAA